MQFKIILNDVFLKRSTPTFLRPYIVARNTIETEHSYAEIDDTAFSIESKYADDITYVSTSKRRNETIEETVPKKLKKHDLGVNAGKTERYTCPDPPNTTKSNSWKSCTESDITSL